MQTRSSAGQNMAANGANVGWSTYNMPSWDSSSLRTEEASSSNEGRAPKRLQTPNGVVSPRPSEPTPASSSRPDPFPTPANRRRQSSIRDYKGPQSSTTLQASPSKRLAYNGAPTTFTEQRKFASNMSQETRSRAASINNTSRFSFASLTSASKRDTLNSSSSFDFLPPVNFDDFHTSITSDEADINSISSGGISNGRVLTGHGSSVPSHRPGMTGPSKTIDSSDFKSRVGLNGSLLRRHNSSAQQSGQEMLDVGDTPTAVGPVPPRARRKTYFPASNTGVAVTRAPRKSVGPGILSSQLDGQAHSQRRPSLAQAGLGDTSGTNLPTSVIRTNVSDVQTGSFQSSRHHKTKSLQPPPRKAVAQDPFSAPNDTPDQIFQSPTSTVRPSARLQYPGTTTPSSTKRLSTMPGSAHATGLGARTISPTDARRLKRMSTMPTATSMPYTPPAPQVELPSAAEKQSAPSPSVIPRKSVTPSSSRTTPDPNRKSYSSGVSNSSTTSYNSFLASTGSLRMTQSTSTSRLPTPKSRGETILTGDDEIVPPVPAIPKAYESPKAEFIDQPFFAARKSSLSHDVNVLSNASTTGAALRQADPEHVELDQDVYQTSDHKYEIAPGTERKPVNGPNGNRRTLQPLRLPPLNLLPLSTPTTSKIAALSETSAAKNKGNVTPPPKVGQKMTPTTPMTASKASFSTRYYGDNHVAVPSQVRSSSSHHNMRPEPLSYRAASSSSTTVPNPREPYAVNAGRTAVSPFVSSSLPKSSGEFTYRGLQKSNTFDVEGEARHSRLTGPRLQKPRKASKDDTSSMGTASPIDVSTPSIGSAIKRKLSLTRKRSASKAQTTAERDAEIPPKPPKHDDMPPPRLPASATWSGPLFPSPSPSQKSSQSRTTRNASVSSSKIQIDRVQSSTWDTGEPIKADQKASGHIVAAGSKRTTRSVLEGPPNQNAMSLKDFLREAKTIEAQLDRDDIVAEEEMKRLASKRKETENAAKEVDSLQRRATAKERVSPSSALRIANLNIFEKGEVVDYKDIYFCGTQNAKKHVGDLNTEVANFGYDDERGDYNIVNGDHLAYRYEIIDILGKGSFGQVVRCIDHRTGVLVAIKIIRNKKRFHQQALVEVDILQKLREWDSHSKHSMVNFVQSFYFRGHLCISTELLGINLYEFIKCHDFRGFSIKLIRRFAKQLLSSLVLLKAHKVIHCDLKPENVLLAHPTRSEIKVIDFGSSCLENEKVYTYIQSRFYRSPEVILGMTYGMPIDMWSLGCILAELLTGYPIFPGENEQEQLSCIMEVFGPPEKHLIEKSTRKKLFFDSLGKPRITVSSKGKRRRPSSKSLQQALKCEDEAFLDFITRCLRWDPDRRLNPDEALHHEFITGKNTKAATRPRTAPTNSTSSPLKRYNSISQTAASNRPLPDPPTTSFKPGTTIRNRDFSNASTNSSQSPSKAAAAVVGPKRHSTMNGLQSNGTGVGIKRTLNGAAISGSALPRVTSTPRVGSANVKPNVDLAAAAAVASLKSR